MEYEVEFLAKTAPLNDFVFGTRLTSECVAIKKLLIVRVVECYRSVICYSRFTVTQIIWHIIVADHAHRPCTPLTLNSLPGLN